MAAPYYSDHGNGVGYAILGNSLLCPYPLAGCDEDDIALAVLVNADTSSWQVLSGWQRILGAGTRVEVQWHRCTGGEGASKYFVLAGGSPAQELSAYMFVIKGCDTEATPYEHTQSNSHGWSSTVTIPTLPGDTTRADSLSAHILVGFNDKDINDDASHYSKDYSYRTAIGTDYTYSLFSEAVAATGNPGADSYTASGAFAQQCRQFVLRSPAGAASGYGNDVNTVAAATIGKVNGVATADISKVIV